MGLFSTAKPASLTMQEFADLVHKDRNYATFKIWTDLVKDAPAYRITMGTKYPSDVAGMSLLRKEMATLGGQRMPVQGNRRWEDLALHLFGVIMSLQAFPDGNKRLGRAAYAILMAGSGLDFKAPNRKLGGELAAM